jgi:hypothetical protein
MGIKQHRRGKNVTEYIPKNPKKYVGKYPILCRSKWERMFCQWVDVNKNIVEWSSENIQISYLDNNKPRRYYPDFYVMTNTGERWIVEIKPEREIHPPRNSKKKSLKTIQTEQRTYQRNMAKFKAANLYAKKMGMSFKILTEKQLFKK